MKENDDRIFFPKFFFDSIGILKFDVSIGYLLR